MLVAFTRLENYPYATTGAYVASANTLESKSLKNNAMILDSALPPASNLNC